MVEMTYMKKAYISLLILIIVILAGFILFGDEKERAKTVEYNDEGTVIKIVDSLGEPVLTFSIESFRSWAKDNWDIFEERPQIGTRDVEPEYFYNFDRTATVSPDLSYLAFSVHDYALASYISFIGIIDLSTEKIDIIKDTAPGAVRKLLWSPEGSLIAYALETGRAEGDYLSVDNVKLMQREFILSEKDILAYLLEKGEESSEFMPEFRDIEWIKEGDFLQFTTNLPENDAATWNIRKDGKQLEKIDPKEPKEAPEEEQSDLEKIVKGFLGRPYERGPLGEGENEEIYRADVFDCTTLVLVSVSKLHSNGLAPEEMIKKINYYPPGEVSYENRLHFSSHRNQVSDFFEDITRDIAPELYQEKKILLNKKREGKGRLIDIDWEKEITLPYIRKEDVSDMLSEIPPVAGVAFLVEGDEEIGLDIRHEGFLFEGKELLHASLSRGAVFKEDFLQFLENSDYDGVNFFYVLEKL